MAQLRQLPSLLRVRPFDTSTDAGRSRERLRRAAITTLASGASKAAAILAGLVTVPLTYRYLGPERYGLWMVMVSIIGAMWFADLGIGNGLVNAIAEAHGKNDRAMARDCVSSGFVMLLAVASVLAISGVVAYPFIPWMRLFNVRSSAVAFEGARAIVVLYAWFVVSIPLALVGHVQWGLQRGFVTQAVSMLGSIATLLVLLLVIAVHASLAWLVFGSTIGSLCSTVANAWMLFRSDPWLIPSWRSFRIAAARKIMNLGFFFFVLQCGFVLGFTTDNIVIAQVMGAAAVAAYAVPQKVFSSVSAILGMAIAPLWPAYGEAIARGDVAWVRKTFFTSLGLALGVAVPCCTILALAGPWILTLVAGKSFHISMLLLIALAAWGVVHAICLVTATLLNGAGILKEQMGIVVVTSLSNLGLSIYLTIRLGVVGVCLGSLLTQTFITLPAYYFLVRKMFATLNRRSLVTAA